MLLCVGGLLGKILLKGDQEQEVSGTDYCFILFDLGGYCYGGISLLICMVASAAKKI